MCITHCPPRPAMSQASRDRYSEKGKNSLWKEVLCSSAHSPLPAHLPRGGKASKVGRVYRANALQNTSGLQHTHRAPFSLAFLQKKKKKKHFACFQTPASHAGGGRAWTCRQPAQRKALAGPACRQRGRGAGCRIRSHYAICFSHLLCSSAQAYVQGEVHVCVEQGTFFWGRRRGSPIPACLPRDPQPELK